MDATLLIAEHDVEQVFSANLVEAVDLAEKALIGYRLGHAAFPPKTSQIFDPVVQDRINCMPATLMEDGFCGVKWVSVFPRNSSVGLPNVQGTILLSETHHGKLLAVIGANYLTGLRTAAVGAVAARYLAPAKAADIALIGAGAEARFHLDVLKSTLPEIRRCRISSRTRESSRRFVREGKARWADMEFVDCGCDFQSAVVGADIIVTATSAQEPLLKAEWIKPRSLYIHVGGWEDEFGVASMADKIVCDSWEAIKHRGSQTLSRMYREGLLADGDIYCNLDAIVAGEMPGREAFDGFVYFCSVGLSFLDVEFAKRTYEACLSTGLGKRFAFNYQ